MTHLRARTKLAAEMTGIDAQRFNEAVAAGNYPCAPRTVPGRARAFDLDDLLTLKVYGFLQREGVTPEKAGRLACDLRAHLSRNPGATHVMHVETDISEDWKDPSTFEAAATHMGGYPVVSVREWRLDAWRQQFTRILEDELAVVGQADQGEEA